MPVSGSEGSFCAGCALNISQWWLILWTAAKSWVESFWFLRQILQLFWAKPKTFFHSLYLTAFPRYISLPTLSAEIISVTFQPSNLFLDLSVVHLFLHHTASRNAGLGFEVCLLHVFLCRIPKLPLWSATFEIWRMRSRCWRRTAY